ncbi:MAG: aminopeptidase [Armatimonadota bacterium]|nr:aminopeptidase [Armatimonadota bacterium]MDR7448705.1 aminopeptidase [Armatimonadota bacterium]MDR7460275.1 aminopeptidase [Armatimonadota bacterium]MDR7479043.1 aminopeptidase [Armatimonadota bacterium]MDR7502674.1 aminopeptidase [Armatimonadota bacterium]
MIDQRWRRTAEVLVNYSAEVRPGDRVLIVMVEPETFPLAVAVYEAVIRSGGLPHVQFGSAYLERALMQYGNEIQVNWVPEPELDEIRWADAYIGLRGARSPHEFAGVPADVLAAHRRAMGIVSRARNEGTRWVLMRVPTEALAQQAGMPLDEMMAFFFRATLRDWAEEARTYEQIRERFQRARTVRVTGHETELTFSTVGRTYIIGDGRHNMPDGEIYTAPVEDSVEGVITFEFPGVYGGVRIPDIRLVFERGQVVSATASANADLLCRILDTDVGARRVGEFGVGVNFGIDRFIGDVLFDEKMGGTVHLALGRAYAECGGTNDSAIHWDVVKDLRTGGTISLDGEEVFRNGSFRF